MEYFDSIIGKSFSEEIILDLLILSDQETTRWITSWTNAEAKTSATLIPEMFA